MERKIGETFEFEGKRLIVKEKRNDCDGCFFDGQCYNCRKEIAGNCSEWNRSDHKEVIFIEVQEQLQKLNLCEILKNCPQGETLWSPMLGDVKFSFIDGERQMIFVETIKGLFTWEINADGTISIDEVTSPEIMLYPSRTQRDWSVVKYEPKKAKFDPKTLQVFDKVLVIDTDRCWTPILFSYLEYSLNYPRMYCFDHQARKVVPYNDDTKHLLGTTQEAPDFYRYWED